MVDAKTVDLTAIDAFINETGGERGALIPVLQKTQDAFGYLPRKALAHIADRLDLPLSSVLGVATFYSQFYLNRRGKNIIRLCDGTACHVAGAPRSLELLEQELQVKPGETTPDYEYTLEVVYCLGACAISPVAVVNGQIIRWATPERIKEILHRA